MPEFTPNARPWPPTQREPYEHWDHCTYGKGFGSAPGCDCGTEESNDLLEAYWEGFDDARRGKNDPS